MGMTRERCGGPGRRRKDGLLAVSVLLFVASLTSTHAKLQSIQDTLSADDTVFFEQAVAVHQHLSCPAPPPDMLPVAQQGSLSCCNGKTCPYLNGVCCANGQHCCPAGTMCLPPTPFSIRTGIQACAATASMLNPAARACVCESATPCNSWPCDAPACKCAMQRKCYPGKPCAPKWITSRPQTPLPLYTPPPVVENTTMPLNINLNPPRTPAAPVAPIIADNSSQSGLNDESSEPNATALPRFGNGLIRVYLPVENVNYTAYLEHPLLFHTKLVKDLALAFGIDRDLIDVSEVYPIGRQPPNDNVTYILQRQDQYKKALKAAKAAASAEDSEDSEGSDLSSDNTPYTGESAKPPELEPQQMWNEDDKILGVVCVVSVMPPHEKWNSLLQARTIFQQLQANGTVNITNVNSLDDEWIRWNNTMEFEINMSRLDIMVSFNNVYINDNAARRVIAKILKESESTSSQIESLKNVLSKVRQQIESFKIAERKQRVADQEALFKAKDIESRNAKAAEQLEARAKQHRDYIANENSVKSEQRNKETAAQDKIRGEQNAKEQDKKRAIVEAAKAVKAEEEGNKKQAEELFNERMASERSELEKANKEKTQAEIARQKAAADQMAKFQADQAKLVAAAHAAAEKAQKDAVAQANAQAKLTEAEDTLRAQQQEQMAQQKEEEEKAQQEEDEKRVEEEGEKKEAAKEQAQVASQAFAEAAKQMRLANADRLAAKMKEASLLGVAQTKAASVAAAMQMEVTKATAAYSQVLASARTAEAKLKAANAEIEKAGSAAEQQSLKERKAIDAQLERQVALAKQQAAQVKAAAQKRIKDMQVQYKANAAKQKAAAKDDKKALKTQLKAKQQAAQKQVRTDILLRAKKEAERLVKTAQLAVTEGASFGLNQFLRHSIRGPVCNPIAPILRAKPGLIARWGFDGDLRDSIGSLHGIPVGGRAVYRHGGVRFRKGFTVRTEKITQPISAKTLEVFVRLGKKGLKQRKAGVMTLTNSAGTIYDGISYGLFKKRRWAVNSEKRARSKRSKKSKKEKRAKRDFVAIAIVYGQDGKISVYRNGRLYQKAYRKGALQSFAAQGAHITFGAGHGGSAKWLRGVITEARLYNRPLTQVELEQSFKYYYECPKDCANLKWTDRGPFPADCVRGAFLHAGCDHTGRLITQVGSPRSWWQKQTWGTVLQDMNAYYQLDIVHGDGQRKGTCSTRPNKLNVFQKVYVSWMSFNFPNHYIVGARNGMTMLLPTSSPNFGNVLASFRMVPALGNPRKGFVSFESLERPGFYLRQVATPIIERRVGFLEIDSSADRPRRWGGPRPSSPAPRPAAPAPRPQPSQPHPFKSGGSAPQPRPFGRSAPGVAPQNGGVRKFGSTGPVPKNGGVRKFGSSGSAPQNGGVRKFGSGNGSSRNSGSTGVSANGARGGVARSGTSANGGRPGASSNGVAANGKASGALSAGSRKPNPPPRPPSAVRGFGRRNPFARAGFGRRSRSSPSKGNGNKSGGRKRGNGRRRRGRGFGKKNRRGKKKSRKGKKKSKKSKKRKSRGRKRAAAKEQNVKVDIKLQASDGSAAFAEDASFKLVKGLAAESTKNITYISFESMMRAGWFMRHQSYQFKMHKFDNSDLFKKDATFIPKQSLVGMKNDKEAEIRLKNLKMAQLTAEDMMKKSKVEADEAVRRQIETARVKADKQLRSEAKVKRRVKRMNKAAEKRQEKKLAKAANKEIKVLAKKLKAQAKQKRAQEEKGKKAVTSTLFKKLGAVQTQFDQAKSVAQKARKRALAIKKKFAKMQLKARRLARMARKAKQLIARERRRQRIRTPLRTTRFFYPYGSGFAVPQVGVVGKWKKRKALCMLSGLVKGYTVNTTEVFAKVPGVCRPSSRLIFDGHGEKGNTMRIDLFQNGSLARQAGSVKGSFFSLDGFVYPMRNASLRTLPLEEPWVNLEHSYQPASWMKVGDFCFLSGVIRTNDFRTSSWLNTIAYLPKKCRPKGGKLLFSVNHHEKTHRIDISRNGRVEWVSGNKTHAFISLSGIGFMTRSVHRLKLSKGLASYGKGFRKPSYHKQGHVCALSGVLAIRKKPAPQNLFRLPRECRPAAHHTYAVNQQRYSLRINVLRNGYVKFVYPAPLSYIPLDGIRFLTDSAKPEKLYRLEMKPLRMRALSALTGLNFAYNDIARLVGSKPFVSTNKELAAKLNDGRYGDDSAWRAAPKPVSGKIFAGIKFGRTTLIRAISFGRDNTGRATDKALDTYTVQYTQVRKPSSKTPEKKWRTIGNITYTATPQLPPPAYVNDKNKARTGVPEPSKHHLFEFSKRVAATAVRIVVTQPTTTLDEIEVYKQRFTETSMVAALVGGNASPANLASAGVTVFGSSAAPGFPMRAVVDGAYGQDYAWAPNASMPLRSRHFVGLRWDKPIVARSIAWGRDNNDIMSDRVPAKYVLQYTLAAATEKTSDAVWRTIGVLPYSAWKVPFPHRRHVFNFNHALKLRALRILVEGTSVIDEIEVYGDRFPVIKPLKSFYGGSFEKKNLARTDNARAMVSSSYPLPQHKAEHVNDGVYGNANSWLPDKNFPIHNKHFAGIQFEHGEWIQSIAWGRDNTDTNKDRSLGSYTLQYAPVMADEYSEDKVWITLGTVTLDGVTIPQPHRRHVFNLSRKVFMMAFRIVLSDPDNAIDEIELYDRKLSV